MRAGPLEMSEHVDRHDKAVYRRRILAGMSSRRTMKLCLMFSGSRLGARASSQSERW